MFISINRKKIKYFEILLLVIFPTLIIKIIDSFLFWLNPFNTFIDSTYIYTFGLGLISLSLLVWDRESLKTKFEFSENSDLQKRRYILNIAGPYIMIIFFTILTIFSSGSNSKPMIENYRYLIEDTSSNYINNNNPPVSVSMEFANESENSNNFIELNNVDENIDPNWIKSTSKKLYNYAKNNDWDSFLEVVYSSVDAYEDMLTAGLNVALMLSAPPEIIYKLMNDGAEIYPTSLYTRFNEANVDYLLELENLGVDFSMLQPMNFKMIDLTFLTRTHSNVFNFVLERNATNLNQVNEIGLDSLGMAIVNAQINPDKTVYFISTLIQHGAMINSDHKTLLTNLKIDSPYLYAEIVAGIPQFTE